MHDVRSVGLLLHLTSPRPTCRPYAMHSNLFTGQMFGRSFGVSICRNYSRSICRAFGRAVGLFAVRLTLLACHQTKNNTRPQPTCPETHSTYIHTRARVGRSNCLTISSLSNSCKFAFPFIRDTNRSSYFSDRSSHLVLISVHFAATLFQANELTTLLLKRN